MRARGGKVFRLDLHLERLRRSAAWLRLPVPWSDAELAGQIEVFCAEMPGSEHYLRLLVTRGCGPLGYGLRPEQKPGLYLLGGPFEPLPHEVRVRGYSCAIVKTRRLSSGTLDPSLKTGNLLNLRLALMEAQELGFDEALLLNQQGHLTEASACNVFLVDGAGCLLTPDLGTGLLGGVTRKVVLELAPTLGIKASETRLDENDLEAATEVFLTGTTVEVLWICRVGDRVISEAPGPITSRLAQAYSDYHRQQTLAPL